ncbi:hypothetical protein [Terrisporobacter mayombei]|uniref:Carboxypeptidase regulatory-like domain-containing protein n=1 Tax=Terrisporobacter mayombei TaxID=1541 RepID=A0ABY9Q3F1_9FIRM|nr:hypothetical protein [Terrisporobacter mayombei]MCC3867755.1 hypothetical protein [Terrisporobacter mayombei]WMT82018.1 hypothetical protein TEMA_23690 [Terrisporobacter mayombei]
MGTYKDTMNVKINQGELVSKVSVLKKQMGSVVIGTVLFSNYRPVNGATAVLFYIDTATKERIPLSYTFTDRDGQFIFTLKNTNCDYVINIVYNEEA